MSNDVQLISYRTREEWLANRTGGIGASESAALFGLSRWDSALSLWTKKRGLLSDDAGENERLEIGLLMEPVVASLYERRTERTLWRPPSPWTIARHARVPVMTASVDSWVVEAEGKDGRGTLEIKNVDTFMADDWEESPPLYYQVQAQHQLAVTGFKWGSVAALIGGNRFKSYDIERNDEFIAELEALCLEFWRKVETNTMPDPDGTEATKRALKKLHPLDDGSAVQLEDEATAWWDALVKARADKRDAEKRVDEYTNKLAAKVGAATFALLGDGRLISYKHQSRSGHVVEPYTFRTFKAEKKAPAKPIEELIAASSVGQAKKGKAA